MQDLSPQACQARDEQTLWEKEKEKERGRHMQFLTQAIQFKYVCNSHTQTIKNTKFELPNATLNTKHHYYIIWTYMTSNITHANKIQLLFANKLTPSRQNNLTKQANKTLVANTIIKDYCRIPNIRKARIRLRFQCIILLIPFFFLFRFVCRFFTHLHTQSLFS